MRPVKIGDTVLFSNEEPGLIPGETKIVEYPATVYKIISGMPLEPVVSLFVFMDPMIRRFAYVAYGTVAGTYKVREE